MACTPVLGTGHGACTGHRKGARGTRGTRAALTCVSTRCAKESRVAPCAMLSSGASRLVWMLGSVCRRVPIVPWKSTAMRTGSTARTEHSVRSSAPSVVPAASGVASSALATSPASATTEVGRATLRRLVAECAAAVVEDEDEAAALTLACLAAAAAALAAAAAALMAVAAALASLYMPVSAAPLSARCAW